MSSPGKKQWMDFLEDEDLAFIKRFILFSGSLKDLADAYNVSYPTLRLLTVVVGQSGTLRRGSPGAVLLGSLEMYQRSLVILTFGGGTNEIQRDLIAIFGLNMPRSLR